MAESAVEHGRKRLDEVFCAALDRVEALLRKGEFEILEISYVARHEVSWLDGLVADQDDVAGNEHLAEAARHLMELMLDRAYPGWKNGDGSMGVIILSLQEGDLSARIRHAWVVIDRDVEIDGIPEAVKRMRAPASGEDVPPLSTP